MAYTVRTTPGAPACSCCTGSLASALAALTLLSSTALCGTVVTFTPTADAFISEAAPTNTFGSLPFMALYYSSGNHGNVLVHFDLSSIPLHSYVHSAVLRLYCYSALYPSNSTIVDLYRLTSILSEDVTWNTRPSVWLNSVEVVSGAPAWQEMGVRYLVQDWVDGTLPNHGFYLTLRNISQDFHYRSRQYAYSTYWPQLVVDYTPPPGSAVMTMQASPSHGGDVSDGGTWLVGDAWMMAAWPNAGWTFVRWSDGDTSPFRTVTVPTGGATYTAYFSPAPLIMAPIFQLLLEP